MVLTSLKRGAPKAPSRLGRWAVRRFVCGRATRMASLASRGGTNLPPEGWLCTVGVYCEVCGRYGSRWRCLALPAWRYLARSCRRQSSPGLAASPLHRHPKGGSYSILHLCVGNQSTRPICVTLLHPRHAPPGARQGPGRLGCASSPPLELGRRPSRAGRLASGAVRARCGPLSSVPAQHGVRPSGCTHATPTSRPSGPWPLLAEPYYCGTGVAEKGSAEGALAAGPLGGPAFRLRACDADGLARFAWRHELTTRRVASYHWCLL